jgi:hypothetical protein
MRAQLGFEPALCEHEERVTLGPALRDHNVASAQISKRLRRSGHENRIFDKIRLE